MRAREPQCVFLFIELGHAAGGGSGGCEGLLVMEINNRQNLGIGVVIVRAVLCSTSFSGGGTECCTRVACFADDYHVAFGKTWQVVSDTEPPSVSLNGDGCTGCSHL